MTRKGLGRGLGRGYKNLLPRDSYIHGLSAKGVKTLSLQRASYGTLNPKLPKDKREYVILGGGSPVGTIKEWKDFAKKSGIKKLKVSDIDWKFEVKVDAKDVRPDYEYLGVKETGDKITEELEDLKLPDVDSVVRDDFNSSSGDIYINIEGEEFGLNYALGEEPTDFNMGRITRKVRTVLEKWKKQNRISGYKLYVPEKKYDSYGSYDGYDENSIEIEYWV